MGHAEDDAWWLAKVTKMKKYFGYLQLSLAVALEEEDFLGTNPPDFLASQSFKDITIRPDSSLSLTF